MKTVRIQNYTQCPDSQHRILKKSTLKCLSKKQETISLGSGIKVAEEIMSHSDRKLPSQLCLKVFMFLKGQMIYLGGVGIGNTLREDYEH